MDGLRVGGCWWTKEKEQGSRYRVCRRRLRRRETWLRGALKKPQSGWAESAEARNKKEVAWKVCLEGLFPSAPSLSFPLPNLAANRAALGWWGNLGSHTPQQVLLSPGKLSAALLLPLSNCSILPLGWKTGDSYLKKLNNCLERNRCLGRCRSYSRKVPFGTWEPCLEATPTLLNSFSPWSEISPAGILVLILRASRKPAHSKANNTETYPGHSQ